MTVWLERHQLALYFLSLFAPAVLVPLFPKLVVVSEAVLTPALAVLLLFTFLSVPLTGSRTSVVASVFPPGFLPGLVLVNGVFNPLLIAGLLAVLGPLFSIEAGFLCVAALVLLAPCIDYVVVFSGLASGAQKSLLKATPLLLLGQAFTVPAWLWIYSFLGIVELPPVFKVDFIARQALPLGMALATVLLPLLLAWLLQRMGNRVQGGATKVAEAGMVPAMILVLYSTVSAYLPSVTSSWGQLIPLAVCYLAFAVLSGVLAYMFSKRGRRLDRPHRISLTFSAVTRNALVVLPIVLGIAQAADLPSLPLAVMVQTLVELVIMVTMVRIFSPLHKKRAELPVADGSSP